MFDPLGQVQGGMCEKHPMKELGDLHTCPFAEEISDDHTSLCNCCSECESNCADDI